MVKDQIGLAVCTGISAVNAIVAAFAPSPIPNGIAAVSFAILAIAWAPRS